MKLELFAICEGAFNNNGRLTIVNTYDYVNVAEFPVKLSIGVAIKLRFSKEEYGEKTFVLNIVNREKNQTFAKMEAKTIVPQANEEVILNLASNVQNFAFQEPGMYDFNLTYEGNEIGSTSIHIRKQIS